MRKASLLMLTSLILIAAGMLAPMSVKADYTPGATVKFKIKLPNDLQNMTVDVTLGQHPAVCEQFNVTVEIQNVEGMTAFGVTLLWNSTFCTANCSKYWLGPEIQAEIDAGNWSGPYLEYCTNNVTEDPGLPVPPYVGAFAGLAATAKGSEYALTGDFVLLILEFHVETYGPGWFYIWKDVGCGCEQYEDLWWPADPSYLFTKSGWMSEAGPQPYDVVWAPGFGPPCAANTPQECDNARLTVVPEFPAYLLIPLFLIATMIAAVLAKTAWSRPRGHVDVV